jgi:hypothetical protein
VAKTTACWIYKGRSMGAARCLESGNYRHASGRHDNPLNILRMDTWQRLASYGYPTLKTSCHISYPKK